jgi:3'-5' exonuclease
MNYLYIDKETIPDQRQGARQAIADAIRPPANMSKPETIAKWEAEEKPAAVEEAYRKTALDGATNHIICISAAVNDDKPVTFSVTDVRQEAAEIKLFYEWLNEQELFWDGSRSTGVCFVGHNIIGFDLKVLRQRSIVLGVRPPDWLPFNVKPWETNQVYDTMTQWDAKQYVSLDKLCRAFGIDGKDGMDGSKVYDAWLSGDHQAIKQYCAADVERVRAVHRKMCFLEG